MRVCRVDVEAWGSLAESASQQLSKGSQVAVQGRLRQDKWADQSGQTRTRLKVCPNLHVNFRSMSVHNLARAHQHPLGGAANLRVKVSQEQCQLARLQSEHLKPAAAAMLVQPTKQSLVLDPGKQNRDELAWLYEASDF